MKKRVMILTGVPGVGKTTVLAKAVSLLRGRGVLVGGMFSREVREGNVRVGFEVVDVAVAKVGRLASVNQLEGPRLGKYRVNLHDLETVGVQAIEAAVTGSDVVVVDEIGPMELFSPKFRKAAKAALESRKLVIAVVHQKAQDMLVAEAKARADAEIFSVVIEKRNALPELLAEKAVAYLKGA